MKHVDSTSGRIALMVAHCAGMVDLVALPVWVGALIARYGFDPQQAGLLATLFLAGAVLGSLCLAPRFHRVPVRVVAVLGFSTSALAFWGVAGTSDFALMAGLHVLAGAAAGASLAMTHGTIAVSRNPHRLFAIVGMALGVFAIVFMGVMPPLIQAAGAPVLFQVFGGVMALAAVVSLLAFPAPTQAQAPATAGRPTGRIGAPVWFGIVGIGCMALVQAMAFSFLERVGSDRGFSLEAVTGVLVALGVVNLFPAALAAWLEKRWSARRVLLVGPVLQAALVVVVMGATNFAPYAAAASVLVAVMIFTHTFAFGLLARLEPSGRALAATPAMLMVGAAIGPVLGGTLVKAQGYPSLGVAAVLVGAVAVFCMSRLPIQTRAAVLPEVA